MSLQIDSCKKLSSYNTFNLDHIETYYCRTMILCKLKSYSIFKNSEFLRIGRPVPKPRFNMYNPLGLELLTHLRLGLSHLNEHSFNQNFEDFINPLCLCSLEVKSTAHFFLNCHTFVNIRNTLLNKLNSINCDISTCSDSSLTKLNCIWKSKIFVAAEFTHHSCFNRIYNKF